MHVRFPRCASVYPFSMYYLNFIDIFDIFDIIITIHINIPIETQIRNQYTCEHLSTCSPMMGTVDYNHHI